MSEPGTINNGAAATEPMKRFMCVSIGKTNEPLKSYGSSISEFERLRASSSISWVNCSLENLEKDVPRIAGEFGFSKSLVNAVIFSSKNANSAYEDLVAEMGVAVPAIHVHGLEVEVNPLFIFMRKGLIVTMHSEHITRLVRFSRYAEVFMRKIPPDAPLNDKITILLTRILDENDEKNFEGLRTIEEEGDKISASLMDPTTPRTQLAPQIYKVKHALITYLNALWSSLDVIHSLRYGDADVITDSQKLLARIGLLGSDINRQISLSEHMSEVLASGLEVLQSIYNNQLQVLNNRLAFVMTWLTILGTAVLVPNTLATIFGNSAFAMGPKDIGWYSILLIGSTVLATLGAWWFIKTKGWLPPKLD